MEKRKKVVTRFTCQNCKNKYSKSFDHSLYESVCPKCGSLNRKFTKIGEVATETTISYHRYKDATAIGYDRRTGKQVALDTKGRRIDISETRYNLNTDPHGWRATGKKVRG